MAIVYCATNTISGKKYIGLSKQKLCHRVKNHRHSVKKGVKTAFYDAWRSYGESVFEWSILLESDSLEEIVAAEEKFVREMNTIVPHGYNLIEGGGRPPNMKGIPKSAEHRRKIGDASRGRIKSEETRRKLSESLKGNIPWNKGLTLEDERVRKNMENVRSSSGYNARGERISAAKKGKTVPWNKGVPRTEEEKEKIREGRRRAALSL